MDLLQATAAERRSSAPDLTLPAATAYLDQLQSLPLKSILSEASGISADSQGVEGELVNLCFREYPTFISVHRCSAAVTSAFDDFSDSLGRLLDAVPALEDECRTFAKGTADMQNDRAKAVLVQEHQDKLFDLLEIPQLMDTCVRNGYYQEALELSAHTSSMLKRYPNIDIIQDISKEVEGVMQVMLAQLLSLLRESIKLPALVKTVAYLRRLEAMEEDELCLTFLVSRLSNFRNQVVGLERDRADTVRYVRKYIDLFREHVFDIISQFTTIFLEGSKSPVPASQLASFVGQCVNDLVKLVADCVPKMASDAASLSSILVQLGYCALAFARVGMDFAPLVTAPFSEAVLLAFSSTVDGASATLAKTFEQAERTHGTPSQALVAHDFLKVLIAKDSPLDLISWDGDISALPTDLARFPPLAILINAHLSALNSLRLLAPLHLYNSLAAAQASALLANTHRIAQYVRQAVASADPGTVISRSDRQSDRPGGRAQLIRRNSDIQLTPEARALKRKETQWVCLAFADTWVKVVVPLLHSALDDGVFDGAEGKAERAKLDESLHALRTWIESQDEVPISPRTSKEVKRMVNGGDSLVAHAEEMVSEPEEIPRAAEPEVDGAPVVAEEAERSLDEQVEAVLADGIPTEPVEDAVEATETPMIEDEEVPALDKTTATNHVPVEPESEAEPSAVTADAEEQLALPEAETVMLFRDASPEAPIATEAEGGPKTQTEETISSQDAETPSPQDGGAAEEATQAAAGLPSPQEEAEADAAFGKEDDTAPPKEQVSAEAEQTESTEADAGPAAIPQEEAPEPTIPDQAKHLTQTTSETEPAGASTPAELPTKNPEPQAPPSPDTSGLSAEPTELAERTAAIASETPSSPPRSTVPAASTNASVPDPVTHVDASVTESSAGDNVSANVATSEVVENSESVETPAAAESVDADASAAPSTEPSRAPSPVAAEAAATAAGGGGGGGAGGGGAKKKKNKKKKGKK